jgi:hypothetical protein
VVGLLKKQIMNKLITTIACLTLMIFAFGQHSWKIRLNNSTILSTDSENETRNLRKIDKAALSGKGYFEAIYTNTSGEKGLIRSILFVDENDNEVMRKDSVRRIKIPIGELKKMFEGHNQIRVFTLAIPADPDKAALVRVRRLHLCTLELK